MIKSHSVDAENASLQASGGDYVKAVHGVYTEAPKLGVLGLADGLRALAAAGLPPKALAAAVEALLRAARPANASAPERPARLVGGASRRPDRSGSS